MAAAGGRAGRRRVDRGLRIVLLAGARDEDRARPAALLHRDARHRGQPHHAGGPQEARACRERARRARDRRPARRPGGGGGDPSRRRRGEDRLDGHRDRLRIRCGRIQSRLLRPRARVGAARGGERRGDRRAGRPGGLPREGLPGRKRGRLLSRGLASLEPPRRPEGGARPRALHRGMQVRLRAGVRVRGAATHRHAGSRRRVARRGRTVLRARQRQRLRDPGISVRDRKIRQEGRPPRDDALREGVRPRRSAGLLQRRADGRRRARRPARSRPRRREVPGGLHARQRDRLHEPRLSLREGQRRQDGQARRPSRSTSTAATARAASPRTSAAA